MIVFIAFYDFQTYHSSGYSESPTNCAIVSYISLVVASSPVVPLEYKIKRMLKDKYLIVILNVLHFYNIGIFFYT